MNKRPTPETNAHYVQHGFASALDAHWFHFARKLERERDELRELYDLDTQTLRAERNEARYALRRVHADLGCELRDPSGTIWDHAARLQAENAALRNALRARIEQARVPGSNDPCGLCGRYIGHAETCRHYVTEREVMQ